MSDQPNDAPLGDEILYLRSALAAAETSRDAAIAGAGLSRSLLLGDLATARAERDTALAKLAEAWEVVRAARAFRKSTAEYLAARHSGNACGIANLADDELWLDRALAAVAPPSDRGAEGKS